MLSGSARKYLGVIAYVVSETIFALVSFLARPPRERGTLEGDSTVTSVANVCTPFGTVAFLPLYVFLPSKNYYIFARSFFFFCYWDNDDDDDFMETMDYLCG